MAIKSEQEIKSPKQDLLDNTRNLTQQWWLDRQWQSRFLWPARDAQHPLFPHKQGHPKLLPQSVIEEIQAHIHTYTLQDLLGDITTAQRQGLIPLDINFAYLQDMPNDQFQEWKQWIVQTGYTQNDHYLPMVEFLNHNYGSAQITELRKEFETLHSMQTPESFLEFLLDERHYNLYLIMQEAHRNWRNQTYNQQHSQPVAEAMLTEQGGFLQTLPAAITSNLKMRFYSLQYSLRLQPQGHNIEEAVTSSLRQIVDSVRDEVQSNPNYPAETSFYLIINLMQHLLKLDFSGMSINSIPANAGKVKVLLNLMQELKADANTGIFQAAA